MTRRLATAVVVGLLALPSGVLAQHSRGADTPSLGTAVPAGSSSGSSSGSSGGSSSGDSGGTSSSGRSRGGLPSSGRAVRGTPSAGGVVIGDGSGFYPWGYPYAGGAVGGYDLYSLYYGGYYGMYDPWYGWFPTYAGSSSSRSTEGTGGIRLEVKPNNANVYVDGFFAGIVDDFDNAFQKLKLSPGPHRIDMRAPEHAPLAVDVMIQEGFTITYTGQLPKP